METFLTILIDLLELAVSFLVTAGLTFVALQCFHACGFLLNVDFTWLLSAGMWILRLMFGDLLIGDVE